MAKIVSVHSFRRGVGKSVLTANVAAILANQGNRVGVVDTNFQSPSLHHFFGLSENTFSHYLNDYLWGQCTIEQTVTPIELPQTEKTLHLIAASYNLNDISKILRKGYADQRLAEGFEHIVKQFNLDILLVDLYSGLHEETLFLINMSDTLITLLRPDQQDYQGTSVTMEVLNRFPAPPEKIFVINEVPRDIDLAAIQTKIAETYEGDVVFALKHSTALAALSNSKLLSQHYPKHQTSITLKKIATYLTL